ncbi:MAG: diacylglycerol/lipid kinase family protein [Leptospirales bacterium]
MLNREPPFQPLRPAFLHNTGSGPFLNQSRHRKARDWFFREYPLGLYRPTQDGTEGKKALDEILDWDPDCLFVGGGDGTVNALLQQDFPATLPIRIIPLGTANVLSYNLYARKGLKPSLTKDPLVPIRIPLGQWGKRTFVLMAGIGFDGRAAILVHTKIKKLLGSFGYFWAGAKAFFLWDAEKVSLRCSGGTGLEMDSVTTWSTKWAVFSRFPVYFPPFPFKRRSHAFSKALWLDIFTGDRRLEFLLYVLERAFFPQRPSSRGVSFSVQRVDLSIPYPGHLDGEPYLSGESISVSEKTATFLFSEKSLRRWSVPI